MMTPEQTWADLTLHGWRPVRDNMCDGIWNDELQVGYGVVLRDINGYRVKESQAGVIRQFRRGRKLQELTWMALGMTHLNKILARLEQT